jgi:hypothetical protein
VMFASSLQVHKMMDSKKDAFLAVYLSFWF